jgi:hypothetical protein
MTRPIMPRGKLTIAIATTISTDITGIVRGHPRVLMWQRFQQQSQALRHSQMKTSIKLMR